MKTTKVLIPFLFQVCFCIVAGAQDWRDMGVDSIFEIARTEVFDGKRSQGQEKLRFIVEKSPGYTEVKIFLARTFSWDGAYDESRKLLNEVIAAEPSHAEGLDALIDVELWSDNYREALLRIRDALNTHPNSEVFLYKHASALHFLGNEDEALAVLGDLFEINPTHEKGIVLKNAIMVEKRKFTAGATYGIDFFSRTFEPAYFASVQAGRVNEWGSSIVRVNHSRRFDKDGFQFETDLYPGIAKGVYAYLNYGFSSSSLFPEHRLGAETYLSLPESFEASGGMRYMHFDSDTKVTIYTGSVGWYYKDFWISLRPFITPDQQSGTSVSGTLSIRRYFKDAENYVSVSGGMGFSPDLRTMQSNVGLSESEIYVLKSQRTGVTWQQSFGDQWSINLSIDLARQELNFDQGSFVLITSTALTLRKKL